MKTMKRVLLFPVRVMVWALSAAFRLLSNLFAYVIGAVMLLGLAAGVYMAVEQRWEQVGLILFLEVGCLVIQFAEEMLIFGVDWVRKELKKI